MTEYNLFALNDVSVPDEAVKLMFKLYGKGANINWELLHKAKDYALDRFPEDADQIIEDFETEIYWTKKKLAKKGLLYQTDYDANAFADEEPQMDMEIDDDIEDSSSRFGDQEEL